MNEKAGAASRAHMIAFRMTSAQIDRRLAEFEDAGSLSEGDRALRSALKFEKLARKRPPRDMSYTSASEAVRVLESAARASRLAGTRDSQSLAERLRATSRKDLAEMMQLLESGDWGEAWLREAVFAEADRRGGPQSQASPRVAREGEAAWAREVLSRKGQGPVTVAPTTIARAEAILSAADGVSLEPRAVHQGDAPVDRQLVETRPAAMSERSHDPIRLPALSIEPPAPQGVLTPERVQRTVETTARARSVRQHVIDLYVGRCQMCDVEMVGRRDERLTEGAHIRPLGGGHEGSDTTDNMLSLCPNCHARFDAGALYVGANRGVYNTLSGERVGTLRVHSLHRVDWDHIAYHRKTVAEIG